MQHFPDEEPDDEVQNEVQQHRTLSRLFASRFARVHAAQLHLRPEKHRTLAQTRLEDQYDGFLNCPKQSPECQPSRISDLNFAQQICPSTRERLSPFFGSSNMCPEH
jgi:hypothetical protein